MSARLLVDLADTVGRVADGRIVTVAVGGAADARVAALWCERVGHTFLAWRGDRVELQRGRRPDALATPAAEVSPISRLWLYANFDCNLACDYCCVSSSPRTARRELPLSTVRQAVAEAKELGCEAVYVTGGEPFLRPDIAELLLACGSVLPTTVLTNGMLFAGRRLAALQALPRDRVALQVSLDSATPDLHDHHRGAGSHARALRGIGIALALGFRVRVAATLAAGQRAEERALHDLCRELGVPEKDRVIRRIAREGAAETGLVVTRAALVPELCLTADGVYWHPVAATDPSMLVTTRTFPLADAVSVVAAEYRGYLRNQDEIALSFPCA